MINHCSWSWAGKPFQILPNLLLVRGQGHSSESQSSPQVTSWRTADWTYTRDWAPARSSNFINPMTKCWRARNEFSFGRGSLIVNQVVRWAHATLYLPTLRVCTKILLSHKAFPAKHEQRKKERVQEVRLVSGSQWRIVPSKKMGTGLEKVMANLSWEEHKCYDHEHWRNAVK